MKREIDNKLSNSLSTVEMSSSIYRGKIEDYSIGQEIGKGAYASVKSAIHKPTSSQVAIKIYEKIKLNDSHKRNAVKREIEVLKKTNHAHIVKLIEVIDTLKQVCFIFWKINRFTW